MNILEVLDSRKPFNKRGEGGERGIMRQNYSKTSDTDNFGYDFSIDALDWKWDYYTKANRHLYDGPAWVLVSTMFEPLESAHFVDDYEKIKRHMDRRPRGSWAEEDTEEYKKEYNEWERKYEHLRSRHGIMGKLNRIDPDIGSKKLWTGEIRLTGHWLVGDDIKLEDVTQHSFFDIKVIEQEFGPITLKIVASLLECFKDAIPKIEAKDARLVIAANKNERGKIKLIDRLSQKLTVDRLTDSKHVFWLIGK